MRNIAFGVAAAATVALVMPASAQERHWNRHHGWHDGPRVGVSVGRAYARDCRVIRSKTVRPNGTVVVRRVKRCH